MGIRLLILVLAYLGYLSFSSETLVSNADLKEILEANNIDPGGLSISIDKSDYELKIVSGTNVIKSYPVVFGGNPVDDKLMQGDHCTPEGAFRVKASYPHKSWSKFIWIDYPSKESWEKHNLAKSQGKIPNEATIGGEIGIHGVSSGNDYAINQKYNWTMGCISLTNKDINEIYPYVYKGMVVHISK